MTALDRFRTLVMEQEASGKTRTLIAKEIGLAESTLCRIMNGQRGAGGDVAARIERWTAGSIRAVDFYPPKSSGTPEAA